MKLVNFTNWSALFNDALFLGGEVLNNQHFQLAMLPN